MSLLLTQIGSPPAVPDFIGQEWAVAAQEWEDAVEELAGWLGLLFEETAAESAFVYSTLEQYDAEEDVIQDWQQAPTDYVAELVGFEGLIHAEPEDAADDWQQSPIDFVVEIPQSTLADIEESGDEPVEWWEQLVAEVAVADEFISSLFAQDGEEEAEEDAGSADPCPLGAIEEVQVIIVDGDGWLPSRPFQKKKRKDHLPELIAIISAFLSEVNDET